MGSQEEQGPAQAAWSINVGANASLHEAGEGQAVSSLMGEFSPNSISDPQMTGPNQFRSSGPFHTQNTNMSQWGNDYHRHTHMTPKMTMCH